MHTSISWNLSHSDLAVQNCSTYQQPLLIVIIAFHPSILSYYTIHALHALYHTCTSRIIPYMHFTLTHASYSMAWNFLTSTIVCQWLGFGFPSRFPQVVWCHWRKIEPFSATLAQEILHHGRELNPGHRKGRQWYICFPSKLTWLTRWNTYFQL